MAVAMVLEGTIIDAGGAVPGPVVSWPAQHHQAGRCLTEQEALFIHATGSNSHGDINAHQEAMVLGKPYTPMGLPRALDSLLSQAPDLERTASSCKLT
jgi:hypothetical protein